VISILYLMDEFVWPLGGTERQFLALIERLDRGRFDPHMAFLRWNPAYQESLFPCPVSSLGRRSLMGWNMFTSSRKFRALTRDKRFDIAHLCFRDASRVGPLWARAGHIPVIVGTRRNLGYYNRAADVALLRLLTPLITHTVANSAAAAREAMRTEGISSSRISVIANGIDMERFRPISTEARAAVRARWGIPQDALVVGSVANLRPIKNVMFLVENAPELLARFPNLHVVVLGEGTERPRLARRIAALGLGGRVILPGVSDHVPEDIQGFDVAVLCSHSESSPNALIEYLAAGRPAVATAVGGAAEILSDASVGFLYPPGDAAALRRTVSALLEDPVLRARVGEAARRSALERFSMNRMVREHESLYELLLERAAAARVS
jgi:glycosyltransferase involved in cell wall biosynthesis